ncbi:MAG: hypothetical protein MK172_09605 [Verrucomicrobiales bacterium]|nr:hypothetical protein [Verrucomicrobiales bacterium]
MSRKLAERLILSSNDDGRRLDFLFGLLSSRKPSDSERKVCEDLLRKMRSRYESSQEDATALISQGDASRDAKISPTDLAAWTQLTTIVLASDVAILMY